MGLAEVDEKLFKLQATPPLDVSITALEETIAAAEGAGVEAFKIARAKKKVTYATKVQALEVENLKQQKEMAEFIEQQEDWHHITSQFGYHAIQAYEHNMKVLGGKVP